MLSPLPTLLIPLLLFHLIEMKLPDAGAFMYLQSEHGEITNVRTTYKASRFTMGLAAFQALPFSVLLVKKTRSVSALLLKRRHRCSKKSSLLKRYLSAGMQSADGLNRLKDVLKTAHKPTHRSRLVNNMAYFLRIFQARQIPVRPRRRFHPGLSSASSGHRATHQFPRRRVGTRKPRAGQTH